ncbi:MAG TPA: hypothetical protein VGJ20_39470 [Xanthobacteraceae bacterium]|jgi:broad-specificity NMP kinase
MTDDIVAELDRYVAELDRYLADDAVVRRARDEIVTLRERLREQNAISVTRENAHAATRIARAEALEEAARVCEQPYTTGSTGSTLKAIAKAIRALKDKRDD